MKTKMILALVGMALIGCDDQKNDSPDTYHTADQAHVTAADTNDFEEERGTFRDRINTRLEEMAAEIEEAREKRKMEKDARRIKEYDADIERRERDRKTLREHWETAETKTRAEWEEFKREVEVLFRRDDDTTGMRDDPSPARRAN